MSDFPASSLRPIDAYRLMTDTIQPRPIALVSSVGADGSRNLSPFSFFNGVGSNPPSLVISVAAKRGDSPEKDTLRNIRETGEFVVGLVSEETVEKANQASFEYAAGVSEFDAAGFTPLRATVVKAALIAESPVNFECRLLQLVPVGEGPGSATLVVGEIVHFHVDESVAGEGPHRADPEKLRLVGRMGGVFYSRTRDRFELARPVSGDPATAPKVVG
ncbi:MAG: flavin reductase family protein [Candidatus Sumerlaeia bacterium]|nr:flavin reductase family protein [Candidatus Sumerlaeia bacterium]